MGLHLLQLVPLVGMLNEDASKNREGDGSLALVGCCLDVRHNNQPIVGGSVIGHGIMVGNIAHSMS